MEEQRTIDDAITELREYVRKDRVIRGNKVESDFEKFCEGHCRDIELVLDAIESLERIADGKRV